MYKPTQAVPLTYSAPCDSDVVPSRRCARRADRWATDLGLSLGNLGSSIEDRRDVLW
jgi:hypothetical protein